MSAAEIEVAPVNVWQESFASTAKSVGLAIENYSAEEAALSEAHAAAFVLGLLRKSRWLRWRFPHALSEGEKGHFVRWLEKRGHAKLGLSSGAIKKFRGAFRRLSGKKVYDIYFNIPDLQKLYPLGLLPVGQLHFLGWLSTYGRADQQLTDEQVLWFLQESAENWDRGASWTYLVNPKWQEQFPLALTHRGWPQFGRWFRRNFGKSLSRNLPATLPHRDQHSLEQNLTSIESRAPRALDGVNILSHFCNPSGIQQAALWTKAALERSGLRTSCRDVPVPRRAIAPNRTDWLGLEIFPITLLTHAATPYFVSGYERAGLFRRTNVYRIAYWAWELETLPDEWVEVSPLIDEIWAPTEFVAKSMRAKMPVPVYNMLPGVEIGPAEEISRAKLGIPQDRFVFLFMFDLHSQIHRKNPGGLIRAFRRAFSGDDRAVLLIKTSGGDLYPLDFAALQEMARGDNIILVDEMMSRAGAYGMIAMCDCFVSLHRSEGFGLGLAEAMLMGKPVIATAYSGNLDFMNQDNSMLVDFEMTEIKEDRPIYSKGNIWAEPSVEHAAFYLRHVYENREEARMRAERTMPEIRDKLSLAAAGQRMHARLQQITAR